MIRAVALLAVTVVLAGCEKRPVSVKLPAPLSIPPPVEEVLFDFESWDESAWSPRGKWQVREVDDATSGARVLERTVLDATAPVMTWDAAEFADVQLAVRFRIAGEWEKTEVGLILRAAEGWYYAVRAKPSGAVVLSACASGELTHRAFAWLSPGRPVASRAWHTLSVTAIGDQFQCQLDGRVSDIIVDGRFKKGKVGLWWFGAEPVQVDDLAIRSHAGPIEEFEGLDWNGVTGPAREAFFKRVNLEKCPCGSTRTLARCRERGCVTALERGREIQEQCESQ